MSDLLANYPAAILDLWDVKTLWAGWGLVMDISRLFRYNEPRSGD